MWDREKIDAFIVRVCTGVLAGIAVLVMLWWCSVLMGY